MANKEEWVEISGNYVKETPNAVLLVIDVADIWFPKSQIRDWPDDVYDENDDVVMEIKEWLAIEKNLV